MLNVTKVLWYVWSRMFGGGWMQQNARVWSEWQNGWLGWVDDDDDDEHKKWNYKS